MLKKLMKITSLVMVSLVATPNGIAQTADEKGLAIATEVDLRDFGWIDSTLDMEMILHNKHGDKSTRELKLKRYEIENDGDKSLISFGSPKDIKGTTFLSYTHALKADDQWLFLPALKRVKRIASANKSGPFVGSEFAYEDLSSVEVEKFTYKWIKDELLNDRTTHVIERTPAYKHSGYTRQIVWIDKEMLQPLKIEFYDRKNSMLKILTLSQYKQYLNKYWRPNYMEMNNQQTNKKTILNLSNYAFRTGLTGQDFDKNRLRQASR